MNPLYMELRVHPAVLDQIWARFSHAMVNLFVSRENAHCPLFFLHDQAVPLGDAFVPEWLCVLLYVFHPLALIPLTLQRVQENCLPLILIAPHQSSVHSLAEMRQLLCDCQWPLSLYRDLCSQADISLHPHPQRLSVFSLRQIRLPQRVVNMIQCQSFFYKVSL